MRRLFLALGLAARRRATDSWCASLERAIAELEGVNQQTESDFLLVGGQLREIRETARHISADVGALTGLISGERGQLTADSLARVLDCAREMERRTADGAAALATLRESAARVREAFTAFRGTAAMFHVLGTLIRIETSRLGSAGTEFGSMADGVKSLADEIRSQVESALESAARAQHNIETAVRTVSELQARALSGLAPVIAEVMRKVDDFRARQQRASEASARMALDYQAIAGAVEELVAAIQFHDITRQQSEHAIEALRQLSCGAPTPASAAVVRLQCSQLAAARESFVRSVETIRRMLEDVAGRVRAVAAESRGLLGFDAVERDSFFLEMERALTGTLNTLAACAADGEQLEAGTAELAQMTAAMQASANAMAVTGLHMQRLALNAGIRSAHIGTEGNVLATLAGAMQELADGTGRSSGGMACTLAAMAGAAANLAAGPGSAGSGAAAVLQGARDTLHELHASSESAYTRCREISTLGERLCLELDALRGRLGAGELFAGAVSRCCAGLLELSGEPASGSGGLAAWAGSYTMRAEREVHAAVAAGAANLPVPSLAAPAGLGDNVELF